ncbi:MAG: family peptidase [Thermoleophilia bacterium]|nr:family peptidase [Thermoleophilia bacterium]
MQLSLSPAEAHAGIDHAMDIGRQMSDHFGFSRHDGFATFRPVLVNGKDSSYEPFRHTASIGLGMRDHQGPHGALAILETTLHEGTHHLIRQSTPPVGLLAGGGAGMVGEGVAQVMAGVALALFGANDAERAWGVAAIDPRGDTTPLGKHDVPLSLRMDDIHPFQYLNDMGGVHVHAGIVQNAHRILGEHIGIEAMGAITADAIRTGLTPVTGIRGWAKATLHSAERLHGRGSDEAAQVRHAWHKVQVEL